MVRVYRMQRREFKASPRNGVLNSKAEPAFTILQEEVSMISSCLTKGLLIAENAG